LYESLTFDVDFIPDNARIYLSWADVQISFPLETSTAAEVDAYLHKLLSEPASAEVDYTWPAEHLLLQRRNLSLADSLLDRQLSVGNNEGLWRVKMELNDYLGFPDRARDAVLSAIRFREGNPLSDEGQQAYSLQYWREQLTRYDGPAGKGDRKSP
ncbi:MAG: hypothetical protein AAFZ52_19600, partial [Bacteroidota bacterium]